MIFTAMSASTVTVAAVVGATARRPDPARPRRRHAQGQILLTLGQRTTTTIGPLAGLRPLYVWPASDMARQEAETPQA